MKLERFHVAPGRKVRLSRIDPAYKGAFDGKSAAQDATAKNLGRLAKLQYQLYADGRQSLLVVLQALDAGGKDGVIRHVFTGMDPQGIDVFAFKQPNNVEAAHDFLWRAHLHAPEKGEVAVFNRSHYEDVLVVRVHELVPQAVWSQRYDLINDFEKLLALNGTRIVKIYLHISPDEQLQRFGDRLEDPMRRWKISEADYKEREFWPQYIEAYEDVLNRTSTPHAPWYVIPANHKWFRDYAISQIVADTMEDMHLELPPVNVDLDDIARKYHAERQEQAAAAAAKRKKR